MSITPENAPFRPAYVRDSNGLYYRIGGGSTEAGPSVDVQPPTIPTGFATTALSTTGFTVTWAPATDNVGVTGYEVERNGTPIATVTGTTYTASGLPASTPYTIRVRARDIAGNWSGWSLGWAVTTATPAAYVYVNFTVSGSTFSPEIETTGTMTGTIDWLDPSDTVIATGPTPTLNLGQPASRVIRMRVNGADANRVRVVNIGYYYGDDIGYYETVPASYNHPAQPVTGIAGLPNLPNLVYFLAARTPLSGFVNFTGLSQLTMIECFQAHVNSINLTGCTSLIRFCFEANDWDPNIPIDLNPVAPTLKDLRMAGSRTGAINFAPMTQNFVALWHWCVREQIFTNHPASSRFPVVDEYWEWGCTNVADNSPGGLFQINSPASRDVRASYSQGWRVFDDAGRVAAGPAATGSFDFTNAGLTSVLLHTTSVWRGILLNNNPGITSSNVDQILSIANSWNTSGGSIQLTGCSPPSNASVPVIAALRARGWTVNTEAPLGGAIPVPIAGFSVSPSSPQQNVSAVVSDTSTNADTWNWNFGSGATPGTASTRGPHNVTWSTTGNKTVTLNVTNGSGADGESQNIIVIIQPAAPSDLWTDSFDRVAANVAAFGNGWHAAATGEIASLDGANLVRSSPGGAYYRLMTPTTVALPNDLGIEVVAPNTSWVAYSGIGVRYNTANASGIKAFLFGPTQCIIGNTADWAIDNADITLVSGFPAGWAGVGDHAFRLEVRGQRADVFADGQHVGYRLLTGLTWANDGLANAQVGIVGDPAGGPRQYRSIRVFPVTGTSP